MSASERAQDPRLAEATGPATLTQVMEEVERQVAQRDVARFRPVATGFDPLDDVLNGGLRPGELLVLGGPTGVGKTIFGLQVARNVARRGTDQGAVYVCYEHDRAHLMSRLLCLESAEQNGRDALTLRQLADMALRENGLGLMSSLRRVPRYAPVVDRMASYADRLLLVKASGDTSTLERIEEWLTEIMAAGPREWLLVVDYLQKIPVELEASQPEAEATTRLTQALKELAMVMGVQVMAIAASDRPGLKSRRMRFTDLRGSSAMQYEADVGLVLNNKYDIVSREHIIYNPAQAEAMRRQVVITVEKNRSGRHAVDMEFALDGAHFRIAPSGQFVRERLIDERVVLE